jgi:hypothetical protein
MHKILLSALIFLGGLGVFFVAVPPHTAYADVKVHATVLGICGNGLIEPQEQCDGTALDGGSCASLGYATGTVSCSASCAFDVSECIPFPETSTTSSPTPTPSGIAPESYTTYTSNPNYPNNTTSGNSTNFSLQHIPQATSTHPTSGSTTTGVVKENNRGGVKINIKPEVVKKFTQEVVDNSWWWILVEIVVLTTFGVKKATVIAVHYYFKHKA